MAEDRYKFWSPRANQTLRNTIGAEDNQQAGDILKSRYHEETKEQCQRIGPPETSRRHSMATRNNPQVMVNMRKENDTATEALVENSHFGEATGVSRGLSKANKPGGRLGGYRREEAKTRLGNGRMEHN